MQHRKLSIALTGLLLATSFTANADILFHNLGTAAPPATVGGHAMTAFDLPPQAAIAEYASVSGIPGNPAGPAVMVASAMHKYTLGYSWGTHAWPGSYLGPAFFSSWENNSVTLTLPPNTHAFYFYLQNNSDGNPADTVTVTANSEVTSGPVLLNTGFWEPNVGANGFAFYSTNGEAITTITIQTTNTSGFAIANFGINGEGTTCASEGYTGTQLRWCQIICESESSSSTIETYLRRWINRYHDLPYCAVEDEGEEGEGGGEG